MTTAYTSLLGLALPVTGELSGVWGDTVNNSITTLLDSAIAGTQTITADTTLTTTTGSANTSRQAILLCSPASANITITAPAQSKIYTVINTSAVYTVKICGVGPTTGVTLAVSESAVVAWNGTDFIRISSNSATTGNFTVNGNLVVTGNTTLGDADTDTITQAASYVTGTQLKSAKTATNTLSLAAYDVDGTAYTDLITLTASNTPTLALTSTGVGTINNMSIGATTASTGAFTTLSATGVTTVQAGTVSAPAITTTGDLNTGIFFPAADTIAFTEGGVESMRITSAGNVGIGTSAPAVSGLEISRATGTASPTPAELRISTSSTGSDWSTTSPWGRLSFFSADTSDGGPQVQASISAIADLASGGRSALTFNTGAGSPLECLRITSGGLVGIGTSSPDANLTVNGAASFAAGTALLPSIARAGDLNTGMWFPAADTIAFSEGGVEAMRITSAGNVGIGCTTSLPGVGSLSIKVGQSVQWQAAAAATIYCDIYGDTSNNLVFRTGASPTERMRIDSAGNVGIGTSSPNKTSVGRALTVNGSANAGLELAASDTCYGLIFANSSRFSLDTNNSGANIISFFTSGAERARIDSSGNVGIGTSSVLTNARFDVRDVNRTGNASNSVVLTTTAQAADIGGTLGLGGLYDGSNSTVFGVVRGGKENSTSGNYAGYLSFGTVANGLSITERMRITSAGNVGIGTSGPVGRLHSLVSGAGDTSLSLQRSGSARFEFINGILGVTGDTLQIRDTTNSRDYLMLRDGNVGIGTSSPVVRLDVNAGTGNTGITTRSTDPGAYISFVDDTTTNESTVYAGAVGNNFVTAAGGSERARITSDGDLLVGKTSTAYTTAGSTLFSTGEVDLVRSASPILYINRLTDDGTMVVFSGQSVTEGSISVSGSTVSYNGGHLSRWAQMLTKPDLLKGTVMSNLDEMNVYIAPTTYWTEEDELPEGVNVGDVKVETHEVQNEQLNKVKVSDVEGDANVAGVFVNWDHDEDHNVDEINMAMTGDMIIRIAQGVTVARGDLLMSAGDGTAKPQGDDIVRSKTIAKVTSTHVTCTYADGSFCVPCVLMAC
jgi:hypothetical protein